MREIKEDDVQGIFDLDSDPEVHQYLGKKPIASLEDAASTIEYIRNQYKKDDIGRWAVIEKQSNEFVGWSGLKYEREVREDMDYYDLGYRFRKKFWGKGYATESSLESLKYGFQVMGLKEIFAGAHIENIASNRVLQKVGFRHIETFEYDRQPHHWYRISRDEWAKNRG